MLFGLQPAHCLILIAIGVIVFVVFAASRSNKSAVMAIVFAVIGIIIGAVVGWLLAPVAYGYANCPTYNNFGCQEYYWQPKMTGAVGVGIIGAALGLFGGLLLGRMSSVGYSPHVAGQTGSMQQSTDQVPIVTPQLAQNLTAPTTQSPRAKCPHCGTENASSNKFCGNCGQSMMPLAPAEKKCPHCGAINAPEFSFCGDCGTPLTMPRMKPTT